MSLLLDKSHLLLLVFLQLLRHPILVLHQLLRHPILEFLILLQYPILSSQKKQLFHKKDSFISHFFYSVRAFARIRQHYFSNYGGTDAWAVPTSNFGGTVPPVPLGFRPCCSWW